MGTPEVSGPGPIWYGHAAGRPRFEEWSTLVRRVLCPGSFDPVTNGHLDIISRASRLYDEVVIGVLINVSKQSLFTVEERVDMMREVTKEYGNVRVETFRGLTVDFCKENDIPVIVRGLRAVSDFDYELQIAQMNHRMAGVETIFMATNPLYAFLSSSLMKEVVKFGGDVSGLVPDVIQQRLIERLRPPS